MSEQWNVHPKNLGCESDPSAKKNIKWDLFMPSNMYTPKTIIDVAKTQDFLQ